MQGYLRRPPISLKSVRLPWERKTHASRATMALPFLLRFEDTVLWRRSESHHNSHSHSHSRARSPARSTHSNGFYSRPSYARSASGSIFGGSSRGIFNSSSSSSYYKRRPRDGYVSYLVHKLQRMVKELWYYARRHPVKAFFAVVVPLLSAGGAIGGLMRQFGVRLPMMGGETRYSRGAGGYYGSSGYDGGSGAGGFMGQAGSLMQIAKAFM